MGIVDWTGIEKTEFVNPDGKITNVKLLKEIEEFENFIIKSRRGRFFDLVAHEEMSGGVNDQLDLVMANAVALAEYDFDLSKINKVKIPL